MPSLGLGALVRSFSGLKEAYSLRKMQNGDGVSAPIGQSWSEFGVMYLTLWYL